MTGTKMRLGFFLCAVLCLPVLVEAKDGEVVADLTARKVVASPAGKELLESAETARPGDVIEYRATYTNQGTGTVRNLEGTLPIPSWTEYLPGTASPAAARASIDGKLYGPIPLKRKVNYSDGRQEIVDIPWAEYRFVRWNLGELAPAAKAEGVLRVRVMTSSHSVAPEKSAK